MKDFLEKLHTDDLSPITLRTYAYNLEWLRKRMDFDGMNPPPCCDVLDYMDTNKVTLLRRQNSYIALKNLHKALGEKDKCEAYGLPLVECRHALTSLTEKQERSPSQNKNWVEFSDLKKYAAILRKHVYSLDKDKAWSKDEYATLQMAFILTYHLKFPVRRILATVMYSGEGVNTLDMKSKSITYTKHKNSRWRKEPYTHKLTREMWKLFKLIHRQQKLRELDPGPILLNRYWGPMTLNGYSTWFKREMKRMPDCGKRVIGCMAIRHSVISHYRRNEMRLLAKKDFANRCMHSVKRNELYVIH